MKFPMSPRTLALLARNFRIVRLREDELRIFDVEHEKYVASTLGPTDRMIWLGGERGLYYAHISQPGGGWGADLEAKTATDLHKAIRRALAGERNRR